VLLQYGIDDRLPAVFALLWLFIPFLAKVVDVKINTFFIMAWVMV